jgi:iron complex outermembrane receptor protein
MTRPLLTLAAAVAAMPFSITVAAEPTPTPLEPVVVTDQRASERFAGETLGAERLIRQRTATGDTASVLRDVPGVSLYGAGGVSSLPAIHGMADDRVRVKVDGMDLISSCANHMNPPLSYIDPSNVGSIRVFAGITPVSMGGDSIGGTIAVASPAPEFAAAGEPALLKGQAGIFYRSNSNARGGNLAATIAGEKLSASFSASTTAADDYKAAQDFKAAGLAATGRNWLAGDEVGSTAYKSGNQSLKLALRHDSHLLELKLGKQDIPNQGFPNQRMDMTGNDSRQINLRYAGQFQWGALEARVYGENTRHKMQFGEDKRYWYGAALNVAGMPMDTEGKTSGALLKADLLLSERDTLRLGAEFQRYRLNDWWDPVANSMMMAGPNKFLNINNGQRDRFDVYAEWEARWNPQWLSQLGLRAGAVKMNADAVQGYSTTGMANYSTAAAAFNAANRADTDKNIDLTALMRYSPAATNTFEFGFARKTRSPSLYERYTWANTNSMVMNMNNWVGDGNGYVGNVNLKQEVAHTLSLTAGWHDAAQESWKIKATPYYTHVQDYIDAVTCASVGTTCAARTDGFVNLSLANQSARLYGLDLSWRMPLGSSAGLGEFTGTGLLNHTQGKNLTSGEHLYNIMPLNLKLAVAQRLGGWNNAIEVQLVQAKTRVQAVRKEMQTAGYGLMNVRSSYDWKHVRLDAGIDNLLNKFYAAPLGGAYIGQGDTMSSNGTAPLHGTPMPGMGRSVYLAATLKF